MTKQIENEQSEPADGSCLMWLVWGAPLSFLIVFSLVSLFLLVGSMGLSAYLGWAILGFKVTLSRPDGEAIDISIEAPASVRVTTNEVPRPVKVIVSPQAIQLAPLATPTASPVVVAGAVQPQDNPPQDFASTPLSASANKFTLIPIKGDRGAVPAADHADLNLKLRDPQPIQVDPLALIDIDDAGIDPAAPKLSAIFKPNFTGAYTVYDWDWACNCKGELLQAEHVVLVGIATTPGEPILIPPVPNDIYIGKYYATVLYASEDSLTFVYDDAGHVVTNYTIHYLGLQTDPDLLALFRQSEGNMLPGLTLETPVGLATDELIVAIRDNGTFMDARSRRDWWD